MRSFVFIVLLYLTVGCATPLVDDFEPITTPNSLFGVPSTDTPFFVPKEPLKDPFSQAIDARTPVTASGAPPLLSGFTDAELAGLASPGIKAAIQDLRLRAWADLSMIQVLRAERATWQDTSLGCAEPEMSYDQVITPGLHLILAYQGSEYDYRIGGSEPLLCTESTYEPLERQPLGGFWSRLAGLPTPRSEVAAATLHGKIYVFGGFGDGATSNEAYDPASNSWHPGEPIPQGVDHAAAVALNDMIYLIGGFSGDFRPVNTLWVYDPETDAWDRKADLPTLRGALGAVAVSGRIFAIGGVGSSGELGAVEEYDPVNDTWQPHAPMPTPRDHVAISAIEGKIYVIGGRSGSLSDNLDTNEMYDPETNTWASRTPMPTPRSGIASADYGGRIFVFGGESVDGTFGASEAYNPVTDTWEAQAPMPTARHGLASVTLDNRIYALAGGPTPGGSTSDRNEVFIAFANDGP